MKKYYIPLLMVILSINCYSKSNKAYFNLSYSNTPFFENKVGMYGFSYESFIYDNFSLNYSMSIGYNNSFNYKTTAGIVGGVSLFVNSINDIHHDDPDDESDDADQLFDGGSIFLSAFLFLIPEGVNYYIPLSRYVDLGLYCNPLSFTFADDENTFTSSIGIKFIYHFENNSFLMPYVGYNFYYEQLPGNISCGLSYGWQIDLTNPNPVENEFENK